MDLSFILLLVFNVLLYLLVRFSKKRKWLNNILTIAFSTLVTLTVIETAYRFFFKKKGPVETGNYGSSMNTPLELTGFTVKNIPDIQTTKKMPDGSLVFDVHYGILPDSGFNTLPINHRRSYRSSNRANDSAEVVFLGCSFTFGVGINDSATIPWQVGKALDVDVQNLGGSGFGVHQAYQILRTKYATIPDHKKRVFVYTFIPDHLIRAKGVYSWCLNDPYFTVKGDSLHLEGPAYKFTSGARAQVLLRVFSLNRTLSIVSDLGNNIVQAQGAAGVNDEDYKRVELMLAEMGRLAKANGDQFIVLHWDDYKGSQNPKGGYYVEPAKMTSIFEKIKADGVTTYNVSSFYNFAAEGNTIPNDNHPSVKGAGLVAGEIVKRIKG